MKIKGINHLLFSVSHLYTSIDFHQKVFDAKLLVKGKTTAYFDLNGIWLALNEEPGIPRNDIMASYTHIAFTIEDHEFEEMSARLKRLQSIFCLAENEMNAIENQFILPIQTVTNLNFIQEPFKTGFVIINRIKHIWIFMIERPLDITQNIYINLMYG